MSSLKKINQNYIFTKSFKNIVKTNQEISVIKMQQVRSSVLEARSFIEGLVSVFGDININRYQQILSHKKKKGQTDESLSLRPTNGKTAYLLLTPSNRFSGNITQSIMSEFKNAYAENKRDVFIVGQVGYELFQNQFPDIDPKYFDLDEKPGDTSGISQLFEQISQYQQVFIIYGQYISLAKQTPAIINPTADSNLYQTDTETINKKRKFLVEPTLEKILEYFETRLIGTFINSSIKESNLATLGARVSNLEQIYYNTKAQEKILKRAFLSKKRSIKSKKQRERLSGIALWT